VATFSERGRYHWSARLTASDAALMASVTERRRTSCRVTTSDGVATLSAMEATYVWWIKYASRRDMLALYRTTTTS
jgi:hypothetical protein